MISTQAPHLPTGRWIFLLHNTFITYIFIDGKNANTELELRPICVTESLLRKKCHPNIWKQWLICWRVHALLPLCEKFHSHLCVNERKITRKLRTPAGCDVSGSADKAKCFIDFCLTFEIKYKKKHSCFIFWEGIDKQGEVFHWQSEICKYQNSQSLLFVILTKNNKKLLYVGAEKGI